jgi:hypothetical protein
MTAQHVTEVGASVTPSRPALTWRRSLVVLVIVVVVVVASRWGISAIADVLSREAEANSPDSWAGVGVAILMGAVAQLVALAIVFVGVPIGLRGRAGSRRFFGVFAAMLAVLAVICVARFGFGVIGFPFVLSGPELGFFVWVVVPLFWIVPAYATALIRLRTAAIGVGAGVAAALITWGAIAWAAQDEQAAYNADYHGPVFVPDGDADDLLAGYDLAYVDLPNEYTDDSSPALRLTFQSESGTGGGFFVEFYDGHEHQACGSGCEEIGSALGGTVIRDGTSGDYSVTLASGTVELSSILSPEQALAVFDGLKPGSIDEFAALG